MYLGKAQSVYIIGSDKQSVIDAAKKYCDENEGWMIWSNVYGTKKWIGWLKWKIEYKINLIKPIDYEIRRNVTKKVNVGQYSAYREKRQDGWSEYIAVYDSDGKRLAESNDNHPEGSICFHWEGFEFIAPNGYSGEPRTECYVKMNDKVFLECPVK